MVSNPSQTGGIMLQGWRSEARVWVAGAVLPLTIAFLLDQVLGSAPPGRIPLATVGPAVLALWALNLSLIVTVVHTVLVPFSQRRYEIEEIARAPASATAGRVAWYGALSAWVVAWTLVPGAAFLDLSFPTGATRYALVVWLAAWTVASLVPLLAALFRNVWAVVASVPVVFILQFLLGGLFVPTEALPGWLEVTAWFLPASTMVEALPYALLQRGDPFLWEGALMLFGGWVAGSAVAAWALARLLPSATDRSPTTG